mmetsp:Transcript_21786/g.60508  ORF Transcript_21786/g.60508 Transcript_21786/m.60508 type:complete len:314 (+) Transcript_21786:3349-4290(+)
MQNVASVFFVVCFGGPHGLEGGETSQDGSADKRRVDALGRGRDSYFCVSGRPGSHLVQHPVTESGQERGSTGQDHLRKQGGSQIDVALHDGIDENVGDTCLLGSNQRGVEQNVRGVVALRREGDPLPVGQCVLRPGILFRGVVGDRGSRHKTRFLLHRFHQVGLGRGGEGESRPAEEQLHLARNVPSGHIAPGHRVGEGESLVHGNGVRDTLTNVQNDAGGSSGCVQTEDRGWRKEQGGGPEGLEENLGHLVSVLAGVQGSFRQQDRVVLGFDIDIGFRVDVLPECFHGIPSSVYYVSLVHGIFQEKGTSVIV